MSDGTDRAALDPPGPGTARSLSAQVAGQGADQGQSQGLGQPGPVRALALACLGDRVWLASLAPSADGDGMRGRLSVRDPGEGGWRMLADTALPGQLPGADFAGAPSGQTVLAPLGPEGGIACAGLAATGGPLLASDNGHSVATLAPDGPGRPVDGAMAWAGGRLYVASGPRLRQSDTPMIGPWSDAATPCFGDPANQQITALAVAHGHLHAATYNPHGGFQIWRRALDAPAGGDGSAWEKRLDRGAWRFSHNPGVTAMFAFGDALYIGTGIDGPGQDQMHDAGPCAAELLRLHADGSWDLLIGEPRFTPDGLKVPLAAMGPGSGDPGIAAFGPFAEQDGRLHVAARSWVPEHPRRAERLGARPGGDTLWSSMDGESWSALSGAALGKRGPVGIDALCASPEGLIVGLRDRSGAQDAWAEVEMFSDTAPAKLDILLLGPLPDQASRDG